MISQHEGRTRVSLDGTWRWADASEAVDRIEWPISDDVAAGGYRVAMDVLDADGRTLSSNHTDITVR